MKYPDTFDRDERVKLSGDIIFIYAARIVAKVATMVAVHQGEGLNDGLLAEVIGRHEFSFMDPNTGVSHDLSDQEYFFVSQMANFWWCQVKEAQANGIDKGAVLWRTRANVAGIVEDSSGLIYDLENQITTSIAADIERQLRCHTLHVLAAQINNIMLLCDLLARFCLLVPALDLQLQSQKFASKISGLKTKVIELLVERGLEITLDDKLSLYRDAAKIVPIEAALVKVFLQDSDTE